MADSDDINCFGCIINRINDPIITDSDAPEIVKSLQFSELMWARFGLSASILLNILAMREFGRASSSFLAERAKVIE